MKPLKLLIVAIIFLGLGTYVYYGEIKRVEKKTKTEAEAKKVFHIDTETINAIDLIQENETIKCVKVEEKTDTESKKEDEWKITAPVETEADIWAIKTITNAIKGLESKRTVEKDATNLEKYGLDKPSITLTVTTKDGKSETIKLGNQTPVGNSMYLQKEGSKEVLMVENTLQSNLKKTLFDIREKRLLIFDRNEVRKIILEYPEKKIVLEKELLATEGSSESSVAGEENWNIVEPIQKPASKTEVNKIISTLVNLRVKEFETEKADDLAPYGLDKPAEIKVTVFTGQNMASQTLIIGKVKKEDESVYAKNEVKNPIGVIPLQNKTELIKDVNELRNKEIFSIKRYEVKEIKIASLNQEIKLFKEEAGSKWLIDAPIAGNAKYAKVNDILTAVFDLKVTEFVDEDMENLAKYGLDKPSLTITLGNKKEGQENKVESLIIGNEKTPSSLYVKNSNLPQIYVVEDFRQKIELDPNQLMDTPPPPAKEEEKTSTEEPEKGDDNEDNEESNQNDSHKEDPFHQVIKNPTEEVRKEIENQ